MIIGVIGKKKRRTVVSRYLLFDRKQLLLAPIAGRQSNVRTERIAQLENSSDYVATREIYAVAAPVRQARLAGRPVVLMIGGHPIKLGLSRFLIDLIEKGFITCLATNGAGLIHDFELACMGADYPSDVDLANRDRD